MQNNMYTHKSLFFKEQHNKQNIEMYLTPKSKQNSVNKSDYSLSYHAQDLLMWDWGWDVGWGVGV